MSVSREGDSWAAFRLVIVACLVLSWSPPVDVVVALPSELHASFGIGWCASFEVDMGTSPNRVRVQGRYDSTGQGSSISIDWGIRHGTAKPKWITQEIPVSFRPMAMTPRAGTTDVMYVAGWAERGGELVIEKWTFVPPSAIGSAFNPAAGAELTVCSNPRIVRSEALETPEDWPVWAMVCSPYGQHDRLLMLRYCPSEPSAGCAEVWEYDVECECFLDHDSDGVADPLMSSASMPDLDVARDLFTSVIPGLGFVVGVAPTPRWQKSLNEKQWALIVDWNQDGTLQPLGVVSTASFLQEHPYPTWDGAYNGD
ncbi:MAG: hypothetical protein H6825_03400 [Planctomycetes bacterium]|nr:hypothetical protein [Planctomycetota bacterium]